jgi:hypothetical protein
MSQPVVLSSSRMSVRPLLTLLVGVALLVAGVLWYQSDRDSGAASSASRAAVLHTIDGTGSTYTIDVSRKTLDHYVDVVNSDALAHVFAGTITGLGDDAASVNVRVESCTQPWNDGACASPQEIRSTVPTNASVNLSTDSLAPGESRHLRLHFEPTTANAATVDSAATPEQISIGRLP